MNPTFQTFRELRDAIDQIPEDKLDNEVGLNLDNGKSTIGGVLVLDDGFSPWICADGD